MKPFATPNVDQNVIESQAVLEDYKNSSFSKGHLNPSMHQETKEDREATFSLTNIVPQKKGSNSGPWSLLENEVQKKFKAFCNGSMYVITGVVPYSANDRRISNRVTVPEYMWSAYCCPSFSANLPDSMKPFFPAYAAVGRNDPESGEEIVPVNAKARPSVRGYDVKKMSLSALEVFLNQRLAASISLFHGECEWGWKGWNHGNYPPARRTHAASKFSRNHFSRKLEESCCYSWSFPASEEANLLISSTLSPRFKEI